MVNPSPKISPNKSAEKSSRPRIDRKECRPSLQHQFAAMHRSTLASIYYHHWNFSWNCRVPKGGGVFKGVVINWGTLRIPRED